MQILSDDVHELFRHFGRLVIVFVVFVGLSSVILFLVIHNTTTITDVLTQIVTSIAVGLVLVLSFYAIYFVGRHQGYALRVSEEEEALIASEAG